MCLYLPLISYPRPRGHHKLNVYKAELSSRDGSSSCSLPQLTALQSTSSVIPETWVPASSMPCSWPLLSSQGLGLLLFFQSPSSGLWDFSFILLQKFPSWFLSSKSPPSHHCLFCVLPSLSPPSLTLVPGWAPRTISSGYFSAWNISEASQCFQKEDHTSLAHQTKPFLCFSILPHSTSNSILCT